MSRTRLEAALERLQQSRRYTQQFLGDLQPDEWFWTPAGFTTHIAWQVAHVACAQYMLCINRVRGRQDADEALISEDFIEFSKLGSVPLAGAENNPAIEEILRVFNGVHQKVLTELAERSDEALDVPLERPHPIFNTKLGAIEWSPQHELIHAGQIALLRRQMGKPPVR